MSFSTRVFNDEKKFEKGGIWSIDKDDIEKNFPGCALMVHIDDIVLGSNQVTDRVTGNKFTMSNNETLNIVANIGFKSSGTVARLAGILPVIGDKFALLMWSGSFRPVSNSSIAFGDPDTDDGLSLSSGVTGSGFSGRTVNDYVQYLLTGNPNIGAYKGCCSLLIDNTTDVAAFGDTNFTIVSEDGINANEQVTATLGLGAGVAGTWPAMTDQSIKIPPSAANVGATIMTLFLFDKKPDPAEIALATRWQAANLNKVYPGFAGRS